MYVSHSFSLSFGLFDSDNYPNINAPCVQLLDWTQSAWRE